MSEAVRQGKTEVVIGLLFVDVPDEAQSWQMSTLLANGRVDAQWDSVVSEAWFSRRLPCRECAPRAQLLNLDALVNQWTATGESQWSAAQDQGKRPLRHDSVVDDLDSHNNRYVKNQSQNAQFDTVRTCLCGITAISTTLSMN